MINGYFVERKFVEENVKGVRLSIRIDYYLVEEVEEDVEGVETSIMIIEYFVEEYFLELMYQ